MSGFQSKFDKAVWKVVSSIKSGHVMSYGQVARAAGYPRHARMVSKAMGRAHEPLPWYRVIKSDYTLAFDVDSRPYIKQKALLEKEGVRFVAGKVVPIASDANTELDQLLWGPQE